MSEFWKNLCIRDGAVAGWLIDEASGDMADFSGGGATMTASGGWGAGNYRQPGLLPGDSDFCAFLPGTLWLENFAIPAFTTAGTMECWAGFSGNTQTFPVMSHGTGPNFEIAVVSGVIRANLVDSGGTKVADSGIAYSTGGTHLVATFDGSNLKMYVNGVLAATTAAGPIAYGTASLYQYIGIHTGGGQLLAGWIEKAAMYTTALDAVTVKNHYAAGVTSYRVAALPPWAGNTDIARRFRDCGTNGQSMRMIQIGDSISANVGGAMQRCLKPGKWVGFLAGITASTPNVNFGIQIDAVNPTWGSWATDSGGTYTFTNNGGTTHNANGGGGDGNQQANAVAVVTIESAFSYARELHRGDFLFEAICRGVQPVYTTLIKRTATGDDAQFFGGLNVSQGAPAGRNPPSGTLTCSGSGWFAVDVTFPTDYPAEPLYGSPGLFSADAVATTSGKTLTISPWPRVATGEAGFEYGNIAVGGTTLAQWSAADGIYGDDVIGSYCAAHDVDTFLVMLGANDASIANYQTHLISLVSRLRGLAPGCAIVLVGTYELTQAWGDSGTFGQMAAACRATAVADGNMLYLDLYRAFGPKQLNYANTGLSGIGAAFYDNFGLGDGVHPSDGGKGRLAELVDSMLQLASYAGDPALQTILNRIGIPSSDLATIGAAIAAQTAQLTFTDGRVNANAV